MGAATSERKITLPLDVDSTELRLWIFSCFNNWPSSGQELARLLFRVAARLHELTVEHQAAYPPPVEEGGAAPEPYAPPTPEEKNAMFAGADPAMSACRNGIISVITARCAKDKCAGNAEKAAAKQSELQATASALLAALLEACSSDARFSHLKESPYIKEDRLAYNVITDDMVKNIWCIPGVRLLFDIIDTVTRQKLTVTTSVSALFDTPSVWLSLAEHRDKIGPPLRALGASRLPTASALITHLEALSIANFVTTCANGAELPQSYREAYQLGANDLSDILANDPTPITVETMNKICEKIRRAMEDRKLASKSQRHRPSWLVLNQQRKVLPGKPASLVVEAMEGGVVGKDLGEEIGGSTETRTLSSVTCVLNSGTGGSFARRETKRCRRRKSPAELKRTPAMRHVLSGGQRERTR